MKNKAAFLILLLLLASGRAVFAEEAVPDGEEVGIVGDVSGKVELKRPGGNWHFAEKNQPVFMGDEIRTGSEGNLGLLLFDQTVFKVGPNSMMTVDEFIFDAMEKDGKVKGSVAKGVLRYVSGKVASKDAEKKPAAEVPSTEERS